MKVSKPYVKKFDSNGVLLNPLPYFHTVGTSRQVRRGNHRIVWNAAEMAFVTERKIKSRTNTLNRDKNGQAWVRL